MTDNRTDNRYGRRVYSGMMPPYYDRVDIAYPDDITETYAFSTWNAEKEVFELMSTMTLIYIDSTKNQLSVAEKTWKRPEGD